MPATGRRSPRAAPTPQKSSDPPGKLREFIDRLRKRLQIDDMTTLTITKARANLSQLLEKAKKGEDIGIVSGDQIVALRPVTVSSDDYAWREYGATPAELASFEKRME